MNRSEQNVSSPNANQPENDQQNEPLNSDEPQSSSAVPANAPGSTNSFPMTLYIADLLCFVPDGNKMWVLAPKSPANQQPKVPHHPYLVVLDGDLIGSPNLVPIPNSNLMGWDLQDCDLTIGGAIGTLQTQGGAISSNGEPTRANMSSLNWMVSFNELSTATPKHTGKINAAAFNQDPGGLLAARLLLEQGNLKVARLTRVACQGATCNSKRLMLTYFASATGRMSAINEDKRRAIANIIQADLTIGSPSVAFKRRAFNSTTQETLTVKPRAGNLPLQVAFVNLASNNRNGGPIPVNSQHFYYLYPLLENWSEDKYLPKDSVSTGEINFLEQGYLPESLDVIRRATQDRGVNSGSILDPAMRCEPPLGRK